MFWEKYIGCTFSVVPIYLRQIRDEVVGFVTKAAKHQD